METVIKQENDRFYIKDNPLRCGKKLELLQDGQWISGRIRYHSDYCFYNDEVGDIKLKDGMKVKMISK